MKMKSETKGKSINFEHKRLKMKDKKKERGE